MAENDQKDTVTCTINGQEITVPKGTRIIDAAEQLGIGIVHYCYHPALSAPAMCRMCLVEVEGAPKLQPACTTEVGDGQVINTEVEKAQEARQGVLEFYLVNHPLDCPICDAAGECKLQDYVHQEGRKHGRSFEPKRVLGQDDFGGDVRYDGDRCIMCTRCVRFMKEIAGDERLCVVQRGNRSVIDTFFDHGLDGSPFADNITDICPVGALLSKDFLHKARAWDLDRTPSVCPGCAQGCNITLDTRDNLVMRLKPRHNPDVNSYWMCDYGRLNYEWMNRSDRVHTPQVRTSDGTLEPVGWQDAVQRLVDRLGEVKASTDEVLVVGSPYHANEDSALLARLLKVLGGGRAVYRSPVAEDEDVLPGFPKLVRRRDLSPNRFALDRVFGYERVGDDGARGGLESAPGVVLVFGDPLDDVPDFAADADLFVYFGTAVSEAARKHAHFVLPVTTFAEQEGTFTNAEGRVQRFWPAVQAPTLARPGWQVLGVILAGLDDAQAPATAADAFLRMAQIYDEFTKLTYPKIGTRGAQLDVAARVAGGVPGTGGA
jgi:NADH-quinone oxidoreductase subunit G